MYIEEDEMEWEKGNGMKNLIVLNAIIGGINRGRNITVGDSRTKEIVIKIKGKE